MFGGLWQTAGRSRGCDRACLLYVHAPPGARRPLVGTLLRSKSVGSIVDRNRRGTCLAPGGTQDPCTRMRAHETGRFAAPAMNAPTADGGWIRGWWPRVNTNRIRALTESANPDRVRVSPRRAPGGRAPAPGGSRVGVGRVLLGQGRPRRASGSQCVPGTVPNREGATRARRRIGSKPVGSDCTSSHSTVFFITLSSLRRTAAGDRRSSRAPSAPRARAR